MPIPRLLQKRNFLPETYYPKKHNTKSSKVTAYILVKFMMIKWLAAGQTLVFFFFFVWTKLNDLLPQDTSLKRAEVGGQLMC